MLTIADIEFISKLLIEKETFTRKAEEMKDFMKEFTKEIFEDKADKLYEDFLRERVSEKDTILRLRAKLLDMKEELILQNATAKL